MVWLLTGLWHGASWNFVLWGLYYAILLLLEKFVFKNALEKMPNFLKHVYTLVLVLLGWLIFYFVDISSLVNALKSLIGLNGIGNINFLNHLQIFKVRTIVIFILSFIFSVPTHVFSKNNTWTYFLLIALFLISIVFIIGSNYNPFIYFRF